MEDKKGDGFFEKKDGSDLTCLGKLIVFLCFLAFIALNVKSCMDWSNESNSDEEIETVRGWER